MAHESEMSTEKLPLVPDEVTALWLGSKLGHKIKSVSLTRTIFGTGTKLFYFVEYENEVADLSSRPSHICVKGIFDRVMFESQPWTLSLAQREADFFAKIAPAIKHMGYPRGWWGGRSEEQGIAIMSDLVHEGCTFPSEAASYPLETVLEGVYQIAGLHAQFWGKSQEDYPWIDNNYDPAMLSITETWDSVVREPGRPKLPENLMDGARVRKAQKKYYSRRNPKFRTLLHGDTHMGNTYFTSDGHIRFLDWSAFHFASCFHDLVYFVSTMMTVEDRRAHEMEILDYYLSTLHSLGGPKLDRNDEELMLEYKKSYLTNLIWPVCGYILQPKTTVDAFAERTIAAWVDHNVIEVVENEP
ncbi:putative aminoglycoside phosphotransferase protein [Daldinia childiae]|uniref:putative aminoglycoside phosphotransferase protein n=1 Tax=Daldinia childiae TaxID=326645 RepID=UPI0014451363|nr:putative aminoglycoside phosphotransferase protein [Daldinia childiae]KAF3064416.1 putative aminoglycoside phosphotransferase protein [Daldinia childiae]